MRCRSSFSHPSFVAIALGLSIGVALRDVATGFALALGLALAFKHTAGGRHESRVSRS